MKVGILVAGALLAVLVGTYVAHRLVRAFRAPPNT